MSDYMSDYARTILDELNVEEVRIQCPQEAIVLIGSADGQRLEVIYGHDIIGESDKPLDVYLNGVAQNKPALAKRLFASYVIGESE